MPTPTSPAQHHAPRIGWKTQRTGKLRAEERLARRWRDWTWWTEASPYLGGRAIGALLMVGIVAPFIGATFLERGLGDVSAVIVLAVVGAVAVAGGVVLLLKHRVLFAPLMLFGIGVACGVCIFVTLTMDW